MERFVLFISVLIFMVFIVIMFFGIELQNEEKMKEDYVLVKYVAKQYDTFWYIYQNMYPEWISYDEALYNFKKDNNLDQYELYENHVYWLRRYM